MSYTYDCKFTISPNSFTEGFVNLIRKGPQILTVLIIYKLMYVYVMQKRVCIKFTNFLLYNPQVLGALIANDELTMSCLITGTIIKSCIDLS